MSLILPENKVTVNYSLKSIIDSFKGRPLTPYNVEKMHHIVMEYVYRRKLSLGRDLNLPLFDEYQNVGKYIGGEVIFDQDPFTMDLSINYVECYGTATEINAVFEDEFGKINCKYFPRAKADKVDEDNLPYWFVWAKYKESKKPIEFYRLWA